VLCAWLLSIGAERTGHTKHVPPSCWPAACFCLSSSRISVPVSPVSKMDAPPQNSAGLLALWTSYFHRLLFFSSSRTLPADYDSSWKFVLMLMSTCTWTELNVPLRDFLCIATALFPCTIIHHPPRALSFSFSPLHRVRTPLLLFFFFNRYAPLVLLQLSNNLLPSFAVCHRTTLQPSFPSFFPTVTCTCTTLLYRCAHS